jgi:hypothetical protein
MNDRQQLADAQREAERLSNKWVLLFQQIKERSVTYTQLVALGFDDPRELMDAVAADDRFTKLESEVHA